MKGKVGIEVQFKPETPIGPIEEVGKRMKIYAKDGEFELAPELVRSLCATYPAVNVRRELERMHLWTLKNAARRWERPLRGIEAWLKKEARRISALKETQRQEKKRTEQRYLSGVKTSGVSTAWWSSDEATLAYGRDKGMPAKPGETMPNYRARLKGAA